MSADFDLNANLSMARKKLKRLGANMVAVVKRGEKDVVAFSKKSKIHLDVASINMKLEGLYYFIGREYANLKPAQKSSTELTRLMREVRILQKEHKALLRKDLSSKSKQKSSIKASSKFQKRSTKPAKQATKTSTKRTRPTQSCSRRRVSTKKLAKSSV